MAHLSFARIVSSPPTSTFQITEYKSGLSITSQRQLYSMLATLSTLDMVVSLALHLPKRTLRKERLQWLWWMSQASTNTAPDSATAQVLHSLGNRLSGCPTILLQMIGLAPSSPSLSWTTSTLTTWKHKQLQEDSCQDSWDWHTMSLWQKCVHGPLLIPSLLISSHPFALHRIVTKSSFAFQENGMISRTEKELGLPMTPTWWQPTSQDLWPSIALPVLSLASISLLLGNRTPCSGGSWGSSCWMVVSRLTIWPWRTKMTSAWLMAWC